MTLPNFVIIGAGRAGTTSTYHYLRQHRDVFMSPIKETNFFAHQALEARGESPDKKGDTSFPVRTIEAYRRLFDGAGGAAAVGEASPRYMAEPEVARRIDETLPDVRLLAILRNPVDRAYSSYMLHVRDGRERRTFLEAIRQELEGDQVAGLRFGQRNFVALGRYDDLLAPYYDRFGADRIGVFLYDDLARDPGSFLRDILEFLDVDPAFPIDTTLRYNAGGAVRGALGRVVFTKRPWMIRLRRSLPAPLRNGLPALIERLRAPKLVVPPLPEEARERLGGLFAEDIARLEHRIGRDLSDWLPERLSSSA